MPLLHDFLVPKELANCELSLNYVWILKEEKTQGLKLVLYKNLIRNNTKSSCY